MAKLVSTIILNYNGRHLLGECLEAVLRQTYPNQEIIVVDNASTDGSQDFVREKFPSVCLLELPENLGASGGGNRGIEFARGEFIALLNNDAVPEPNWLEELCKAMEENSSIGICASRLMLRGTDLINEAGLSWTVWGHSRSRGLGEAVQEKYLQRTEVFAACSAAALYRRSMFDEIGLYDEDFFFCEEDLDLSFRAQLADYRCLYVPAAVVEHRFSATMPRSARRRIYLSIRNAEFVFIKNMPRPLLLKYLWRHLLYFCALNAICILRGRISPLARADWAILKGIPHYLGKRKLIQSRRKTSLERLESLFEQETVWSLAKRQVERLRKRHPVTGVGAKATSRFPGGPAWD